MLLQKQDTVGNNTSRIIRNIKSRARQSPLVLMCDFSVSCGFRGLRFSLMKWITLNQSTVAVQGEKNYSSCRFPRVAYRGVDRIDAWNVSEVCTSVLYVSEKRFRMGWLILFEIEN